MIILRIFIILLCLGIFTQCKPSKKKIVSYEQKSIDSSNFSIYGAGLERKEHLVIKVNDEVLFDVSTPDTAGQGSFWRYYAYPNRIKKVEALDFLNGILKEQKVFKDTLVDKKYKQLILSRPYLKGKVYTTTWERKPFISIDTGERIIRLINDSTERATFDWY